MWLDGKNDAELSGNWKFLRWVEKILKTMICDSNKYLDQNSETENKK